MSSVPNGASSLDFSGLDFSILDVSILGPAIIAGLLVTLTHVPLGRRVLARGIIFLDLAVAQVAGLGLIVAHSFNWEPTGWQVQMIAMSAAILSVFLLHYTDKRWPEIQEAMIGSLFVLASSAGILLLAANPQGGEQLRELLVGQVLWVSYSQLVPVVIAYAVVLLLWFVVVEKSSSLYFYLLFAVTITIAVQLVGVLLVFATLIMPALAVRQIKKHALLYGYLIGIVGYLFGLVAAALFDLPAGASIVFTLALVALLSASLFTVSHKKSSDCT